MKNWKDLNTGMLHYGQVETKTCLKIVLDPDPSNPISKSF
jgi:hypothetical protein